MIVFDLILNHFSLRVNMPEISIKQSWGILCANLTTHDDVLS